MTTTLGILGIGSRFIKTAAENFLPSWTLHAVASGRAKLRSWMRPHALELVCSVIDEEMDPVNKTNVLPGLAAITPGFIKSWTSWTIANTYDRAPYLTEILLRAAETSLTKEKNKRKQPDAVKFNTGLLRTRY